MSTDNFVNPDNASARGGNYNDVLKKIESDKVCPFCEDQLALYHKNPILLEKKYWLATNNMYPYKGAKTHLLLIHKKHIVSIPEISEEAWIELHTIINEMIEKSSIPGGTLLLRFGDTRYTGASVNHLHAQLVSSDPLSENYEPLLTRIG